MNIFCGRNHIKKHFNIKRYIYAGRLTYIKVDIL
nr:MAG TPA: hypothetical protein [Caudoviricetes sp.]